MPVDPQEFGRVIALVEVLGKNAEADRGDLREHIIDCSRKRVENADALARIETTQAAMVEKFKDLPAKQHLVVMQNWIMIGALTVVLLAAAFVGAVIGVDRIIELLKAWLA